jgi:hypothetical protein
MPPGVRSNDGEQRSSGQVICLRAGTVYVGARSALDIWNCCHIRYVLFTLSPVPESFYDETKKQSQTCSEFLARRLSSLLASMWILLGDLLKPYTTSFIFQEPVGTSLTLIRKTYILQSLVAAHKFYHHSWTILFHTSPTNESSVAGLVHCTRTLFNFVNVTGGMVVTTL